jgi:hypothetical protein
MKLTYWVAESYDNRAYSIRTRTRREAVTLRNERPNHYGPVFKVVVEYRDALDLVEQVLGEGGIEYER